MNEDNNAPPLFVVRLWDGFDGVWMDVSDPLPKDEAEQLCGDKNEKRMGSAAGKRTGSYSDIDYYKVFPVFTTMIFSEEGIGSQSRPPEKNTETIVDVDEKTLAQMVFYGLATRGADGVHELTAKGNTWLQEWCAEKREQIATKAYLRVFGALPDSTEEEQAWGLKASSEDALLGVLRALYPAEWEDTAEGIYKLRRHAELSALCGEGGVFCDAEQEGCEASEIIRRSLPAIDEIMAKDM